MNYNLEMGSISEEEEQFFDSKEYITPVSDSGSDYVENSDSESKIGEDMGRNFGYEIWIRSPGTIGERRQKLFKLMGLAPTLGNEEEGEDSESSKRFEEEVFDSARIMDTSGTVLRSSFRGLHSSSQSSVSCCSNDTQDYLDLALDENLIRRIKNLDDGSEFIVDELGQDGLFSRLREVGSNRSLSGEEFERLLGVSQLVQRAMRRDVGLAPSSSVEGKRKSKRGWLRRLGVVACVAGEQSGINRVESGLGFSPCLRRKAHSVRVRTYRTRSKEFSALYMGQDIVGHEGAILTMKFSPDGQLLASAGEDGIVRVWQVVESEKSEIVHMHDVDASHVYFTTNQLGELVPLSVDKEKKGRLKSLRKSSESACVIFPQKVFQLDEKPIHEFHGHRDEVLDLSWSINKVGCIRVGFFFGFLLSMLVHKSNTFTCCAVSSIILC